MLWMVLLNIAGVLAILFIATYRKKYRHLRVNARQIVIRSKFLNSPYGKWMNPLQVIEGGKKARWNIDFRKYWFLVIIGSAVAIVLLYIFFRAVMIVPLGLLGGFALPNVLLYYRKRKYDDMLYTQLSAYVNTLANLVSTYDNNVFRALSEVAGFMDDPVKQDIIQMVRKIEHNISMKKAFDDFYQTYPIEQVKMLHDMLLLIEDYGGENSDVLFSIAENFDRALINRKKVRDAKAPNRKAFYSLMTYLIGMPFALMIFSYDYYLTFVQSMVGKGIFIVVIIVGAFSAIKIERIYDNDKILQQGGN
ncbi:type II secretion system F family protein [Priestia koreensis]|uniref:type II secretion system F family protein n=1 Tax=Priestia koreensis TaxID=284581 RepID=UPI00301B69D5